MPRTIRPYSLLIMRSVSSEDLHAKARIRNAALVRFGQEGFAVGLRAIAQDAGVSTGLVTHHFGSKAGLRQACDAYALQIMHDAKHDVVGPAGPEHMLSQLAMSDEYAPVAAYVLSSLASGGPLATELVEQMTASTVEYLQAGVDAGTIRPSRDPAARARYLVHVGLGTLLVAYRLQAADGGSADPAAAYTSVADFSIGPGLELFTQGLFTDSHFLDAFEAASATSSPAPNQLPATDQPEQSGES